jgi:hypothetical protein
VSASPVPPDGEIILYQAADGRTRIECRFQEETLWLTQALITDLFQKDVRTINEHLQNVYAENELDAKATIRKFRIVRREGMREVAREIEHYSLDAILAVGYRVRSERGTQFRRWATERLREYLVKGFTMDDQRLKNPPVEGSGVPDYFDELLERIRDIRASERRMYLRVKEIFALAGDYDAAKPSTMEFFEIIHNKLHFAATGHTAAELIKRRADHALANMGLTTWKGDVVRKQDVTVAKNYLTQEEISELNRIVTVWLDFAEDQARRRKQVFLKDWETKLKDFLAFNDRAVLTNAGSVSKNVADSHAEAEYDAFAARRRMKEKEKLLKFETKLKFIFSHSALREGWDNPNVFQICALREVGTERERRQTIGRGLRLCVNQKGDRLRGFDVNTLTVIATESYEQFAENLQKEIEQDTGIRFGVVEKHQFASIAIPDPSGKPTALGVAKSEAIWTNLKQQGLLDAKGKIQPTLRTALKEGTLTLPPEYAPHLPKVAEVLRKLAGRLEIKNADERKTIRTRQAILHSEEFKALWDRIKHKTTYRVEFDNEALIKTCSKAIENGPPIAKTRLQWRKAELSIGKSGVDTKETESATAIVFDEHDIPLPDVLTDLQDKTQLTRRSLSRILVESERLNDFKRNPQQFIELAADCISRAKRLALVDGIKYQRIGDDVYYAQELFEQEELTGYLKNCFDATKSIYEQVVYDSGIEQSFAQQLENNRDVKVYAKLPGWFKVPTPLGSYNPDWAVLIERHGEERLYLVVETKSSLFEDDLRNKENANIDCGKAHFKALAVEKNPVRFVKGTTVDQIIESGLR